MSVIAYDRPVLNLISGLDATKHVTHRSYKKKGVTFHHNGGRLSHQGVLNVWKVRPASAHFNIDAAGTCAQYVRVNEYAWSTGNTRGNAETISIEMCNETVGDSTGWRVSETTWKSACRLAGWLYAKVIGTRPTKDNVYYHGDWTSTGCPGPHMRSLRSQVLAETQRAYDYFIGATTPPRPHVEDTAPKKSNTQIAAEVWAGKWGSGDDRLRRLSAAGYDAKLIQSLVNRGVGKATGTTSAAPRKTVTQMAQEVIDNKWGNGDDRRARLAKAGYNPTTIQTEVNRVLGASSRKSIQQLAQEVIAGKWGSGLDRQNRLTRAGYSYQVVQAEVNRLL